MDDIAYLFLGAPDDNDDRADAAEAPAASDRAPKQNTDAGRGPGGGHSRNPSSSQPASPPPATPRKRLGFRDFLSKANIQDQLLDK